MSISEKTQRQVILDANGNVVEESLLVQTNNITRNGEPEFIKIYSKMWYESNEIPEIYRNLFISLAIRMTYCDSTNLEKSQIVYTGGYTKDEIMAKYGWKSNNTYYTGLRELANCHAIRKLDKRGWYQVNPHYAGKGFWKYNPKLGQGGIDVFINYFDQFFSGIPVTSISVPDDKVDNKGHVKHDTFTDFENSLDNPGYFYKKADEIIEDGIGRMKEKRDT